MNVQTIRLSEGEILRRFSDMEKKFGRREGRNYFPSLDFYLNYFDDKEGFIRHEADKMIEYAGLGTYRSNITFDKLDGAAGNIVLNANMVAEITIDNDVSNSIDLVMATLAHEICHKVLFLNGIYFNGYFEKENEVYADLATFYIGFGDLTMKGYQVGNSSSGYLTPDTYAMAYVLMTIVNKDVDYNINALPLHARREIDKASKKCELSKTRFVDLDKESLSQIYSESFSEIRKLYEYYDLLLGILPIMRDKLSFLSKNLSDAFYSFETKDLEWHKFSIANHAFLFVRASEEDNYLLNLYREKFGSAFFNIYEAVKDGKIFSNLSEIPRHCPTCGHSINKKLEAREYHLICPHCKTHFTINGDMSDIKHYVELMSSKKKDFEVRNEELIKENKKLHEEIDRIYHLYEKESHAHDNELAILKKENKQLKDELEKSLINRLKKLI